MSAHMGCCAVYIGYMSRVLKRERDTESEPNLKQRFTIYENAVPIERSFPLQTSTIENFGAKFPGGWYGDGSLTAPHFTTVAPIGTRIQISALEHTKCMGPLNYFFNLGPRTPIDGQGWSLAGRCAYDEYIGDSDANPDGGYSPIMRVHLEQGVASGLPLYNPPLASTNAGSKQTVLRREKVVSLKFKAQSASGGRQHVILWALTGIPLQVNEYVDPFNKGDNQFPLGVSKRPVLTPGKRFLEFYRSGPRRSALDDPTSIDPWYLPSTRGVPCRRVFDYTGIGTSATPNSTPLKETAHTKVVRLCEYYLEPADCGDEIINCGDIDLELFDLFHLSPRANTNLLAHQVPCNPFFFTPQGGNYTARKSLNGCDTISALYVTVTSMTPATATDLTISLEATALVPTSVSIPRTNPGVPGVVGENLDLNPYSSDENVRNNTGITASSSTYVLSEYPPLGGVLVLS